MLREIESCWPFRAQPLSAPLPRQNVPVLSANLGRVVGYRLMGGGYAEDTALAATSRQAQKDCAEGLFDCPTPHTAILANDGNSTATGIVPCVFGSVDVPT
jgi:hypothetical protein